MINSISCFQNLDQLFLIDLKNKLEYTFDLISRMFLLKKVITDLIFVFYFLQFNNFFRLVYFSLTSMARYA